jgi:hypothetical protein
MIPNASQLAALEPSWASRYTEPELRGLLVLGSLFNERLYVHDTQLADHTLLLGSFLRRADDELALFNLLHDLIRLGIVRVCLRSSVVIHKLDHEIAIASLSQLHDALKQRSEFGWIPESQFAARKGMLLRLDQVTNEIEPYRYNYVELKRTFMTAVRDYSTRSGSEHNRFLSATPEGFRREYDQVIARPWFSFIDIIDLCAKYGMRQDADVIQSHGLIDELCYAEWNRTRMMASNSANWASETDVSGVTGLALRQPNSSPIVYVGGQPSIIPSLQEKMLGHIESPGLSLIGTLSAQDILKLREAGKELFQLRELRLEDPSEMQRRVTELLLKYWDTICAYIRTTRPVLASDATKLAIFMRRDLPTLSNWGAHAATFAIDLGLDIAGVVFPGLAVSDKVRGRLHDLLSLRLLFYGSSNQMRNLKKAMPEASWLLERR